MEQGSMSRRIQHIVVGLLLTSYLFVGALAHLESIGHLFTFGSKPEKVEQQRPAQPVPARVHWTQHKHIPSFTKVFSLSPALVIPLKSPRLEFCTSLHVPSDVVATLLQDEASVSSRAPPLLSSVS